MNESKLMRLRDGLLDLKRKAEGRETRIAISELLDIIDEADREDARFDEWCEKHAPNWEPNERERNVLRAFLANGDAGLSREEIAGITSDDDSLPCGKSASIGSVRTFICRLKKESLRPSGSTVEIRGDYYGVYRTTDPSIITLGEVSPPRDR